MGDMDEVLKERMRSPVNIDDSAGEGIKDVRTHSQACEG